ncbi:MAG: phospho-N-acetylmuramoyl-pentapeptide-transferase [Oscillospiraceae bacterium]|nr:phospho-N-acetylmuramoyl-pentapeptide-transferase [Oscillospiraceae bacterium]MBR3849787.1 phospho-N-acetylmuramoyl-pentapeptide-transferase [Oscillospiraceae bacterium]
MIQVFAALCAFVLSALFGQLSIPVLRALKAGQSIREIGPKWHAGKSGTPTMGGVSFIAAALLSVVAFGWRDMLAGHFEHLYALGFAMIFGIIGFLDDFMKVKFHRNLGLTALQKLLLQLAAAAGYLAILRANGSLSGELYIPFVQVSLPVNLVVYVIFSMFVIVGGVNAVNLTDGVDGLATSVTIPVMAFFACAAYLWGQGTIGLVPSTMVGALAGFLLHNRHPAKMFMGDTGSLFLGGLVCGLAFALDMPLVLLLVGVIYIAETLSVILQVAYFKLTHGKRIFKMTPIHHHFEMLGWSEVKIVLVFAAVTVAACVLAFIGVRGRM